MKNKFIGILAVASFLASASSFAAVSTAEVAELQFHKLSRLVQTKKIDAAFADHLQSLKVLPQDAKVLVTFVQESDTDGMAPPMLNIVADLAGKAVSYNVVPGQTARNFVNWGGKSPMDLFEKGLEYVADSKDAAIAPFQDRISTASIAPATTGQGFAVVTVLAGEGDGMLVITLDAQGKVLSAEKK